MYLSIVSLWLALGTSVFAIPSFTPIAPATRVPTATPVPQNVQILDLITRFKHGEDVSLTEAPVDAILDIIRTLTIKWKDETWSDKACAAHHYYHNHKRETNACDACWEKCATTLDLTCLICEYIECKQGS